MIPVAKRKNKPSGLPQTIYVTRCTEGDDSYLMAVEDSCTGLVEIGDRVVAGVYKLQQEIDVVGMAMTYPRKPSNYSLDEFSDD